MKKNNILFTFILSTFFLSLTIVLPYLTGQIPEIGSMLCPMHIPVLMCGFICGWKYGLLIGLIAPIFRSLILGMPPLFPQAFCMSFELATYGMISGLMYNILPKKTIYIFISLIIAMLSGRLVWGCTMFCCMAFDLTKFSLTSFWIGGFANSLPGIIIQIILVPIFIIAYNKLVKK